MGLTDILSTSTLICLGIMLLLLGGVAMFFMQKINEQNHNISSMLGLVSTMAEELNFVRSRMQILSSGFSVGQNCNSNGGASIIGETASRSSNELIPVSDDDDDDDVDDDDDDDDVDDDESESESESESDAESEHDKSQDEEQDKQNIKTINMGETLEMNVQCETLIEEEKFEGTSTNSELEDDLESLNYENLELDNDYDNDIELKEVDSIKMTNTDFMKSIDISSLEESHKDSEIYDYKKMSLNKLRSVVLEKGLVSDSTKLKKNDMLKMLTSE